MSSSVASFSKNLVPIAFAAVFASAAFAQAGTDLDRRRTAADELAAAKKDAKVLADRAGLMALDTIAPVLKSLDFTGSVNAQAASQSVEVQVKVSDNLSGVVYYYVQLRSPSGVQSVIRSKQLPAPNTNVAGRLTVGLHPYAEPFTRYSEPGNWVATYFYAHDAAGNPSSYSEQQIASLPGNHTVSVVNTGGYDIVAPAFAQGTILTPTVKLSKAPPGMPTGTPPFVSADISITDSGNGAISGTHNATLVMCRYDGAGGCLDYLYLQGVTNLAGLSANTLRVGTQLRSDQTTGSYRVYYLSMQDVAGNYVYHFDVDFGGDIDYSDFFTSGATIFINS